MSAAEAPAQDWRAKPVSRAQWWKLANLSLELANVDVPAGRGDASDLIGRLEAAVEADRVKDVCPFEVAA